MKINEAGLELIKSFESLRLETYPCPSRVWTIGYGHTLNVMPGQKITESRAEDLLRDDLSFAEVNIRTRVKVPLNENQFSALTSFAFNAGVGSFMRSTLLRKLNEGDYEAVPEQLMRWNKAGGKVLAGLTRRRQAEVDLWNTPVI